MVSVRNVAIETGKHVLLGGLWFGSGCLLGKVSKAPVLKTGVLNTVVQAANYALGLLTKALAKEYNWNLSTVQFLNALTATACTVALVVSALALGIFSSAGAGAVFVGGIFGVSLPLAMMGLYVKYGGKELPFSEALNRKDTFYQWMAAL